MKYLFFLMIMTQAVMAQHHAEQPLPEDTEDARANFIVFEISDKDKNKTFTLERSPYFDHFLRYKDRKNEKLQKADSKLAKNLDGEFSALYLKAMYEMASKKGQCREAFRLSLRGEAQQICQKEDQKTQMIKSFIQLLEKQF